MLDALDESAKAKALSDIDPSDLMVTKLEEGGGGGGFEARNAWDSVADLGEDG